jgi:AcrR family transcriptional regulator
MAKPKARARTPIWTRPAPGARQPKLSREQIAAAALAIADAEGFAEVSMRRIATELGVGTMTLYYYVKTKDDLIALMDDAIGAEIVLPADQVPTGWRAGLTAIAHKSREVFARHPWALYALQGARIGPNAMRHIEQSLAVVADAPVDAHDALHLLSIVDDYVFGHVLRVGESTAHPIDHKVMRVIADFFEDKIATGEFPHLEGLFAGKNIFSAFSQFAAWMSEEARFEVGLNALLDGFELRMRAGPAVRERTERAIEPPVMTQLASRLVGARRRSPARRARR